MAPLIESLARQTVAPLELVYVIRDTDAETATALEGVKTDLDLRIEHVAVPGNVPPVEVGFGVARGEVVALLDDDARPEPDWIERISAEFDRNPGLGVVAGRVREDFRKLREPPVSAKKRMGRSRWPGRLPGGFMSFEFDGEPFAVEGARGANMAFRRATLRDITFDDRLNVGSGRFYENDLCWQARRGGWAVMYAPRIVVDHYPDMAGHRDGKPKVASHAFTVGHNWTLVVLKHADPVTRAAFVPYWFLWGASTSPGPIRWLAQRALGRPAPFSTVAEGLKGRARALRALATGATRASP